MRDAKTLLQHFGTKPQLCLRTVSELYHRYTMRRELRETATIVMEITLIKTKLKEKYYVLALHHQRGSKEILDIPQWHTYFT
jgi:hypothetical protein